MRKKYKTKIAILSGAGLSAESNLRTFRDCENGYWNEYKIDEVCSIDAWDKNPDNGRGHQVHSALPSLSLTMKNLPTSARLRLTAANNTSSTRENSRLA